MLPMIQLTKEERAPTVTPIATHLKLVTTISQPILPICFSQGLITLYAVSEPNNGSQIYLPELCLAIGVVSLTLAVISISVNTTFDFKISNKATLALQILLFVLLFIYTVWTYPKVHTL